MTIIVVPTERCNFQCTYCFEPQDVHDGVGFTYNFEAMKKSLYEIWEGAYHGSDVCLHGGEPLLMPIQEVEKLLSLIYNLPWSEGKVKGTASIVTNGSNITDEHIKLFKKYNVNVALSCDGPPSGNLHRGPNPKDGKVTADYNRQMKNVIKKLRREKIKLSMMCILHRDNASDSEKLKALGKWMLWLKSLGVVNGRMNAVYSDKHPELELTNHQLHRAWINIYNWNKRYGMRWSPGPDMEKNLLHDKGNKKYFSPTPCSMAKCDPFNTHTISVLPDGTIGNCDRTFAHGIYSRSLSGTKCGRYEALRQTDCKDCKYWEICGGGCPEEGVGGDWRRKTRFCEAIYKTYEYIEEKLRQRGLVPKYSIPEEESRPLGNRPHGDAPHGDSSHGDSGHGDMPHGDMPHGDSTHGDDVDWR